MKRQRKVSGPGRQSDGDLLAELDRELGRDDPEYPQRLREAMERRAILDQLAACRRGRGLTQTAVAAAMETSQSSIARLETEAYEPLLSTVQRFASAVGMRLELRLVEESPASGDPEGRSSGRRRGPAQSSS